MKNKIKWRKENTSLLIQLRHSLKYHIEFEKAKNKPKILQSIWDELSKEMGAEGHKKEVKLKYNSVLVMYRKFKSITSTSGEGKITWVYWNLFNSTFPGKIEVIPNNYVEIGIPDQGELTIEEQKTETIEFKSLENLKLDPEIKTKNLISLKNANTKIRNLKMQVYEALINKLKNEGDINELSQVKKELKEKISEVENKIEKNNLLLKELLETFKKKF